MTLATLSIIFAALFLIILLSLHFLEPEFDPSWRMISEYELGRFGWLMRVAFFSWGASVLFLLIAIWPVLLPTSGTIARWGLVLIVIGHIGAGIFKTDPITDLTNSWVNRLHTLSGAIVIMGFPVVATLAARSLLHNPAWAAQHGLLIFATLLTWLGLVTYFGTVIISRVRNPQAGEKGGPKVYQGWPNRFMVVTYMAWLIIVAGIALRV